MSAQRALPAAPARRSPLTLALVAILVVAAVAAAYYLGRRAGSTVEIMAASPSSASRVAFVREGPCDDGSCQALWVGSSRDDALMVATLAPRTERCESIAWAADGLRVGFVINGYQLRIFDGVTGDAVRQVNLLEPDATPTSRIARGVTFSQNGAAVTFDDCPRFSSGCRSALMAVR